MENDKHIRFMITREGGGGKTELRPGRHGDWLMLEFAFDAEGIRSVVGRKVLSHREALAELQIDPLFWPMFMGLAEEAVTT